MTRITDRQAEILRFIIDTIATAQRPPSFREIADRLGLSGTQGIHDHLRALERKGYIARVALKSRSAFVLRDEHGRSMRLRWERGE